MKSKKRKSDDTGEIPDTTRKLSRSDENEEFANQPTNIVDEPSAVVRECPHILVSENGGSAPERIPHENEEIVTKYIADVVNTITVPDSDSRSIVKTVLNDLKSILKTLHEHGNILPFGSYINGLACLSSDLDLYLETPSGCKSSTQIQSLLKRATRELRKSKMFIDVFAIPAARIPIVRFTHKTVGCKCDLSFTNEIGVRNTLLVRFYLSLNQHLKPLVLFLKYLLELYDLHGCQKITTYMLFWLVVYYMQQCDVLPPVQTVRELVSESYIIDGWDCRVPLPYGIPVHDSLSLFSHLKAFLKFYSEFSFLKYVISPYLACPLSIDDFESLRLPFNLFSAYFRKIQNTEDATFISSAMNLQDPTELNVNITRPVELSASNQFRSFCYHLFNFFTGDIAEKLATDNFLKKVLPQTKAKGYRNMPNDCLQCEIHTLTVNRLPEKHPVRGSFNVNGVLFFASRLEAIMKSDYECNVQTMISDQTIRIRRNKEGLCRKVVPVAYFNCKIKNEKKDHGITSSGKEMLETELFVLVDSTFNGNEIHIRFEAETQFLRRIRCDEIVRSLLQMPE